MVITVDHSLLEKCFATSGQVRYVVKGSVEELVGSAEYPQELCNAMLFFSSPALIMNKLAIFFQF